MAAMKYAAVRKPNERWLMDLILLFMPSTGSVGETDFGPGKNSLQVRAQHLCEFLERLQLGAHSRTDPLAQMLLGTPRLCVIPEQLEGFLQVPGANQRRIPTHQRREPLVLIVGEIPRVLQQQPACSFDTHFLFGSELAPQFTANSIHGLIEMLDD